MTNTTKKIFSFLLSMVMCLSMVGVMPEFTSQITVITAEAAGIDNITARADYLYNLTWTAQANMNGYINSSGKVTKTYTKGQSYRIPYGQPVGSNGFIGYNISIDSFLEATKSASNPFYTKRGGGTSGSMNSNYYSMDCSTFVSYCWGLSSRYTTSTWSSVNATNLGKCTSANVNKIQQGDALNLAGSHIVLVSRVNSNGTYEITEETPPEIKRTTYSASDLVKNYSSYTIYRYNKRDSVAPPPNATSSSFPGEEDNNYSVPISVTASKKINTYDGNGNLESNRWIDAGDVCTIDKVYKNGFVHVGYPTSSGTRWAYAKKDDFDLNPIPSSQSPELCVDNVSTGEGTITIFGWAYDPDNKNASLAIHVYMDDDNKWIGDTIAENDDNEELKAVIGSASRYKHKFSATFNTDYFGAHRLNIAALDTGNDVATWSGYNIDIAPKIVNLGDNFDASIKSMQSSKYIITNNDSNVFLFENPIGYSEKYWNFERQNDGSYRIKSYCNGKYMDVDGEIDDNGINIQSWVDNGGGSSQKWFILKCGDNYVLKPACSSLRVLDVYGEETNDGANIAISDFHGGLNQQVKIEKTLIANPTNLGDNFDAFIVNPESNKFVIASAVDDNVILHDATSGAYASKRIWNFARNASDNSYRITSYYNSKCLDTGGALASNVYTWDSNNNDTQKWYIVQHGNAYRLIPACSSNYSLDITNGITDNRTNIRLWDNNDSYAQQFSINKIEDSTAPTISDVKISDVTKDGYKVTITVSDNVGIYKIAVPTWSQYNGQDDLFNDWTNTALATQTSDNTWTYNVKVSEHNNECGVYYTDVYAWDFSGNEDGWRGENKKRTTINVGMHNLTVDPNGGIVKDESGNQTTNAVKITKNKLIYNGPNYCSLAEIIDKRAGYTFTGFYSNATGGTKIYGTDGKCVNEGKYFKNDLYQQDNDLTVYAQWKANSYDVALDANGGECIIKNTIVTYNEKYGNIPAPMKKGYIFAGWYTEVTGGTEVTADTKVSITENQTLYAHWKAETVEGDLNADGKFSVADAVLLQKWLLGVPDIKLDNWKSADLYEDGKLDVFDLCLMKNMLINLK